jgi:hypothetical protein
MPNWTTNEVTFSSAKTTNIKKIKDIFEKGCPFGQLIKEPNWKKVPLKGNEKRNSFEDKPLGMVGELPIIEEIKLSDGEVMKSLRFKSTNVQDTRWYDWRWEKWGTKWDVPKGEIEITEINNGSIVIGFHTAWSAPIPIYRKLFNKFSDVSIEWWARDEDDDTNGEGYYLK